MNSYEDFHLTWNSRPNLSLSITLRHSMIKALSVKYTCSEEDNVHWCQKWSLSFLSEWCKGKEVKATKTRPFWDGACSPRAHSIHQRSQPKELQRLLRTSTLVRHQTYVKERGTTKKRKSSRTYTKAKTRHLSDVLLQTAILFQEETTCLVSVCVFF